jgi:ATPase family protein associated with various cellular activities (AAA)
LEPRIEPVIRAESWRPRRKRISPSWVLALAPACEAGPGLHHLVGGPQDDPTRNRLALGIVVKLFVDGSAGAFALDGFKLDLSAAVSTYVGETEQSVEQAFDDASAGNPVLFFDEPTRCSASDSK